MLLFLTLAAGGIVEEESAGSSRFRPLARGLTFEAATGGWVEIAATHLGVSI